MPWSTAQVAELTGTTVRTIRHYHDVGLLPDPRRRPNGYKCYGVEHVVRTLRIRRLTQFGLSLAQVARLDARPTVSTWRELDSDLKDEIDRLERHRDALAALLARATRGGRDESPGLDLSDALPLDVTGVPDDLPPGGTELLVVASRVLGPVGLATLSDLLARCRSTPHGRWFVALGEDADTAVRQTIATCLAATVRRVGPQLVRDAPAGPRYAAEVLEAAVHDLGNAAQRDVLDRVRATLGARWVSPEPALTSTG